MNVELTKNCRYNLCLGLRWRARPLTRIELQVIYCIIFISIVTTYCTFRSPDLQKGVYGMGFNAPSKIQETALPTLIADP